MKELKAKMNEIKELLIGKNSKYEEKGVEQLK